LFRSPAPIDSQGAEEMKNICDRICKVKRIWRGFFRI
jgi:hypothetical protein